MTDFHSSFTGKLTINSPNLLPCFIETENCGLGFCFGIEELGLGLGLKELGLEVCGLRPIVLVWHVWYWQPVTDLM